MPPTETTAKKFREEGVRVTGDTIEVSWESAGHLSVRLTDELAQGPLADRTFKVKIPKEGLVELTTDADGVAFHPDVPFQEYELDLGGGVRVHVPAVANRTDVHVRHVPGVRVVFANVMLFDEAGEVLSNMEIELSGPGGEHVAATTDDAGMVKDPTPRPHGTYELRCAAGTAKIELAARRDGVAVVRLGEGGAS